MWKTSEKIEGLIESCQKISNHANGEVPEQNNHQNGQQDENLEMNTGVEFPGESLEPLIGAPITLDDDALDESILVIEYKLKKESPFAFKFLKN